MKLRSSSSFLFILFIKHNLQMNSKLEHVQIEKIYLKIQYIFPKKHLLVLKENIIGTCAGRKISQNIYNPKKEKKKKCLKRGVRCLTLERFWQHCNYSIIFLLTFFVDLVIFWPLLRKTPSGKNKKKTILERC